ncbi:hypothetical protein E8E14_013634 [Neopestalotiopsis sp. 37M]|nr:hypothetical protein E8E14_013634 [Neopestalotiopsis sp. 37M]
MAQHSVYKPLAEGQIRLLNIWLDESEPHGIALSLCHVSLDDSKGEYVALSYTWGRPEPLDLDPTFQPDSIWRLKCDDGVVEVRQNLFDFLQQVRRAESNTSAFWIDAVCINQRDDKEKSEQVLRMAQIYAASSQVWIWLGGRPISIEAQQIIEEFIPALMKHDNDRNYDRGYYRSIDILDETSSNALIQAIGYEKWSIWKSSWRQYRALFARNWFQRGWTVQEAALQAPKHCFALVGSYVIRWSLVIWFSACLLGSDWPLTQEEPRWFSQVGVRVMARRFSNPESSQSVLTAREAVALKHKWHADFLDLIEWTRNLYVEDPRDRIYAYLGIMLQNKPPSVQNSIVPDYALDVELVFRNFATVILQNVSELRMMATIQNSQDRVYSKLPSWVPDFSQCSTDTMPDNCDAGDNDKMKEWLPTLEEIMTPNEPSRDEEFELYLKFASDQKRMYSTTSGRFGIGPASLRCGDQVYIFKGGRVPFVLRQNDDGETYTLLGSTYVHGVMYGEAMTDEFRSSFRPVTLV